MDKFVDNSNTIFFNTNNRISNNDLMSINNVNSLLMLEVNILKVKIKKSNDDRLTANIKYNQKWYNNLTITDMAFTKKYYNQVKYYNDINFYNIKIVVSLGEYYYGYHYKLIATIFD